MCDLSNIIDPNDTTDPDYPYQDIKDLLDNYDWIDPLFYPNGPLVLNITKKK